MPQDELWATRARCTGLQVSVHWGDVHGATHAEVRAKGLWSKHTGDEGRVSVLVPSYSMGDIPAFAEAYFWECWQGKPGRPAALAAERLLRARTREVARGIR